jgi:ribosomal protein S6
MSNSLEDIQDPQGAEEDQNTARIYEAGFHLLSTLSEAQAGENFNELKKGIEDAGGEIISEEAPRRISLAYQVEKKVANKREIHKESYFGWIKFESTGETANDITQLLKKNTNVLRTLVVRTVREDVFYHAEDEEPAGETEPENQTDHETSEKETKEKETEKDRDLDESIDELVVK